MLSVYALSVLWVYFVGVFGVRLTYCCLTVVDLIDVCFVLRAVCVVGWICLCFLVNINFLLVFIMF